MRSALIRTGICLLILAAGELAFSDSREQKLVTRVDTATVVMKGHSLTIKATGMGKTPSGMGRAGKLLRKGGDRGPNKEGLLEYDMVFNAVANYSGFKLKPVAASYKEKSVPPGIRGVRIFGEFNQYDALLPEAKKHKSINPFSRTHKEEKKAAEETIGTITGPTPHAT